MQQDVDDLVQAFLQDPQYHFVFQPLIALTSGQVVGYEILSRIERHGQLLDAETFFAQAHQSGLSPAVDQLLLQKIRDMLPTLGRNLVPFFVNVDPDSIEVPSVQEILTSIETPFVVEITERGDWDPSRHRRIFDEWRAKRGGLAFDDFGSGYSGLEKLVVAGPDYVKLDHRLVRGCNTAIAQQNIIRAMSQLAIVLGFQLLAEGIETEAELKTCMDLGVTIGQGYYLGRPCPWDTLPGLSPAIYETIRTHHNEALAAVDPEEGIKTWEVHNSLMERLLASSEDKARIFHIVQTLYATLHPHSVSCLVARSSGLYPLVSLGHAHRKPVLWEESSLAHKAFIGSGVQVVQHASNHAVPLGSLNRLLDSPESIAIAPVGQPPWGVLGADFQEPYAWGTPRLEVLKTLSNLITLLFPTRPHVVLEDDNL